MRLRTSQQDTSEKDVNFGGADAEEDLDLDAMAMVRDCLKGRGAY